MGSSHQKKRHLGSIGRRFELKSTKTCDDVRYLQIESVGSFAFLDQQRAARTGFAEVVFGQGKTADQAPPSPAIPVERILVRPASLRGNRWPRL